MLGCSTSPYRGASLRALAGGLLLLLPAACDSDKVGPTPEATVPADSAAAAPVDSTGASADSTVASVDSTDIPGTVLVSPTSQAPGIVFGSFNMDPARFDNVHTGTMRGGGVTQTNVLSLLSAVRAKGGRAVLKLCNGRDSFVKNSDGTFSFTKWKALVARFQNVNLGPYISDGTILGHYLIDEPHRASRWGGHAIPQATIEAMAQYSKQLWPAMTTFVRVAPTWLASSPMGYRYLDAGWAQYASGKGEPGMWIAAEVAAAKQKGLGIAVGLNVLDGGNGSSRIRGVTSGQYAMSASELRSYGTTLLNQSHSCAFYNWTYDGGYYGRSDIKSAMADLSAKAKAHAKTSCGQ